MRAIYLSNADRERFWEHVEDVDGEDACWLWHGPMNAYGYGRFNMQRGPKGKRRTKGFQPHRIAYEEFYGEIPDGHTIDHLCHTFDPFCRGGDTCPHRRCCRPTHLEAVNPETNTARVWMRGLHPQQLKMRCPRGHLYLGENLRLIHRSDGSIHRGCRTCMTDLRHAREAKRRRYPKFRGCKRCGQMFDTKRTCAKFCLACRSEGYYVPESCFCGKPRLKGRRGCCEEHIFAAKLDAEDREMYLSAV